MKAGVWHGTGSGSDSGSGSWQPGDASLVSLEMMAYKEILQQLLEIFWDSRVSVRKGGLGTFLLTTVQGKPKQPFLSCDFCL